MHLSSQQEVLEGINQDASTASDSIQAGVKQLKAAERVFGGTRWWVLYFFIGLSLSLLTLDLFLS
jgi:hypothetical protein